MIEIPTYLFGAEFRGNNTLIVNRTWCTPYSLKIRIINSTNFIVLRQRVSTDKFILVIEQEVEIRLTGVRVQMV